MLGPFLPLTHASWILIDVLQIFTVLIIIDVVRSWLQMMGTRNTSPNTPWVRTLHLVIDPVLRPFRLLWEAGAAAVPAEAVVPTEAPQDESVQAASAGGRSDRDAAQRTLLAATSKPTPDTLAAPGQCTAWRNTGASRRSSSNISCGTPRSHVSSSRLTSSSFIWATIGGPAKELRRARV